MIRQGNMPPGSLPVRQKGAKFIQRASGAVEYRVQFKCNTADVPRFLPTPQQVSDQYNNFWLDESDTDELDLEITTMNLIYLGVNQIPPPRYFLRGNKISAPVDTNVNFSKLVTAAGGYTSASNTTSPAYAILDSNGKFIVFGKDSLDPALVGTSTFDDTAFIYSAKFVSASRRLDLIRQIQTIVTPLGNPPSFTNRNWKLSDLSENTIGPDAFYEYEVTWELSGQGGWYPGLYSAVAQSHTSNPIV